MPHPLKARGLPRAPSTAGQLCTPPLPSGTFVPVSSLSYTRQGWGLGQVSPWAVPNFRELGEGGSRFRCQPCLQLCKERKKRWLRPGWGAALGHDLDLVCITGKQGVLLEPLKSPHIQERCWGPERQLLTAQGSLLPDPGKPEAVANPPEP